MGYSINIQTEVFDNTFGNTDTPYIQLGYIVKTICNNGEVKSMGEIPVDVRIDDAVICGKQRMISCSENIIIPCPALPEIDTNGESSINGKKVKILKWLSDVPTPVEHELVKILRHEKIFYQKFPFFGR